MCPRQGSNFLLLAQEKITKEKGTPLAGRPGADCSALLGLCGRAELASFAVLTAFKQAARSQFLMRAVARAAKPCAARRLTRAPRAMRSCGSQTFPVYASLRIGKSVTPANVGMTGGGWRAPMRSEACGEEIAAGVRLVIALPGREPAPSSKSGRSNNAKRQDDQDPNHPPGSPERPHSRRPHGTSRHAASFRRSPAALRALPP